MVTHELVDPEVSGLIPGGNTTFCSFFIITDASSSFFFLRYYYKRVFILFLFACPILLRPEAHWHSFSTFFCPSPCAKDSRVPSVSKHIRPSSFAIAQLPAVNRRRCCHIPQLPSPSTHHRTPASVSNSIRRHPLATLPDECQPRRSVLARRRPDLARRCRWRPSVPSSSPSDLDLFACWDPTIGCPATAPSSPLCA